ncbi:MAG: hypothetical protein DRO99_04955, partial [Candidatus Aenigmatarchaeota archaeon]
MELNSKKGQIYSLIAILLTIPIMLFIAYYVTESQNMRYGSLEKVVSDQMHEVETSLENDFEQALEISGKRAFLAATDYAISTSNYLDDAEYRLRELIEHGTMYGNSSFVMYNQTVPDWISKILALDLGFNIDLNYEDVSIRDLNGFNAKIQSTLIVNISDRFGIASIDKTAVKRSVVSLEGLEDPLFPLNTLGFVSRSLRPYPYPYHALKVVTGQTNIYSCSGEITFDPSDPDPSEKILVIHDALGVSGFAGVIGETANLPSVSCYLVNAPDAVNKINKTLRWSGYDDIYIDHDTDSVWSLPIIDAIDKGYYSTFSTGGPNILMRLEGNITAVNNGLESFVNLPNIKSKGIDVKT